MQQTLWETLAVNPRLWYVVVALGLSAAFPTVVYLMVLIPVIALRVIPRKVQELLGLILFRLTTDNKPVVIQIASFCEVVGTILTAVIMLLG